MSDMTLPREWEEQAILHALGILDSEDRKAFQTRLREDSHLLHQAITAYQVVTDALAIVIDPVPPPPALRERVVDQVAREAARETEQFEKIANTFTVGFNPVRPPDALREQLLSRIKALAELRAVANEAMPTHTWPIREDGGRLSKNNSDTRAHRRALAWRHLIMTSYASFRLCWNAFVTVLKAVLVPSRLSARSQAGENTFSVQQSGNNLTFIKASEGTWRDIAPGVTAKVLSFNPALRRTTTLLRFAPCTSYAPHRHTDTEELYVLQGGCSIAGHAMTPGDYHRAEAGTEHYDTSTEEGCLLLVISSPQNEVLF